MEWTSPKTITGSAAIGGHYFPRPLIDQHFWREVRKGNHILFVAPRRVGKTSVMLNLANNSPEGFICLYQNIEGVRTKNEFYQRLFQLIIQCHERSKVEHVQTFFRDIHQRFVTGEISKDGIKFNQELDYRIKLQQLIPELSRATFHTVIFLDEFAEVINTLKKSNHEEDAIAILHDLRELRSEKSFKNFTIVYAGSVALEYVIRSLDRPKLINDLHPVPTEALTKAEANSFIHHLVSDATIKIDRNTTDRILAIVDHLLPYYIQLMIEELDVIAMKSNDPVITSNLVDLAFENILKRNNNFEDWHTRLERYHSNDFDFLNCLLKHAAHQGNISTRDIYNYACDPRFKREKNYMDYVHQLMNDGYLTGSHQEGYRFVSPLLKKFWLKKFPIHD